MGARDMRSYEYLKYLILMGAMLRNMKSSAEGVANALTLQYIFIILFRHCLGPCALFTLRITAFITVLEWYTHASLSINYYGLSLFTDSLGTST